MINYHSIYHHKLSYIYTYDHLNYHNMYYHINYHISHHRNNHINYHINYHIAYSTDVFCPILGHQHPSSFALRPATSGTGNPNRLTCMLLGRHGIVLLRRTVLENLTVMNIYEYHIL